MSDPGAMRTTGATRVLVVGCGGIGGTVAGTLSESALQSGTHVVALTTNASIAAAVSVHGYRLRGTDGARDVPARCVTALAPGEPGFDWVLLAVQPPDVEAAARRALPHLAADGAMVCFQNGLCEERVARVVPRERVVGGVVAWGASMPEPGLYERTSKGGFVLGRLDGRDDPRVGELARLLSAIGPVERTNNLAGARWSKLAVNCAVSTLGTLAGVRLGQVLVRREARKLALRIMTEAVEVARAEGVRLEKVAGTVDLDWLALTPSERRGGASAALVAKHAMLLAVGARFRKLRSSMLAAIERGRPPAVDFLNGEVADRGALHGVPTPVNARARELVHALARKERVPGVALLDELMRAAEP